MSEPEHAKSVLRRCFHPQEAIPKVRVAFDVNTLRGVKHYYWVVEACPFCGQLHIHNAGNGGDNPDDFLGYRVPDCGPYSYILME